MTTLKPFLTVNNGNNAVKFYQDAFDAKETKRWEMANGKISSVLEIENSEFYVADEEPENGNFAPNSLSNSSIRLILNTTNADIFFEKAIALGATEICPMTTEDSWRIGKLKDPFGHIWEIGFEL
jgi:PhnB protein